MRTAVLCMTLACMMGVASSVFSGERAYAPSVSANGTYQSLPPGASLASLPVGARYCPAPWADNSEFLNSYYAVDANTGKMTRVTAGQSIDTIDRQPAESRDSEVVLYVAPPVDARNRYVPPEQAFRQTTRPETRVAAPPIRAGRVARR